MNLKYFMVVCSILTILSLALLSHTSAADGPYRFLKEIPIGGEGGWDYLSIDQNARRLFVTHATKVVVIDLDTLTTAGEIDGTPGVHGFAVAPKLGRGFSSNGQENKASIVDLKTLATISKVETGTNPDAIMYEPEREEVYVFNGRSNSATVFEAKTGKVITTVSLPGKPEFAVADSKAGLVYNNIEDKNEVVVIDSKTHKIVHEWPIAPGEAASGMAIDLARHRLFLGCRNKMMVMMDSTNGKVVATVPIGAGVDANAFDPETKLVFSSNGEGNVTVAREESADKLVVIQTLTTERGARTMILDPKTHNIFLASAKYEAPSESQPGAPRQRPRVVPGSFKVLVYAMDKSPGH